MKVKVIAIISFIFILSNPFKSLGQIAYGLRGGLNVSLFTGSDVPTLGVQDIDGNTIDAQIKFGLHGGVYAQLPISQYIYIQPELLYSTKGITQRNVNLGPVDATYHSDLQYVDLPILVGITPTQGFSFFLGPQLSYFISGKRRLENEISNWIDVVKPADADSAQVKKFNVGAVVGVGYELNNGLNFSVRGEYGILPIATLFKQGTKQDFLVNNLVFQVSVGYTFRSSDFYYRNKKKRR